MTIAVDKCKKHAARLDRLDRQVGLVRLFIAVALLSVLVAAVPKLSAALDVLLIFISVGSFLVVSSLHKRLQARAARWRALQASYEAEELRKRRDFSALASSQTPWSRSVQEAGLPSGHLYGHDLDILGLLFPLLDTCLTPEASERLAALLLGSHEDDPTAREQRTRRIRALARQPRLLRRLDALRLSEELSASHAQGRHADLNALKDMITAETASKRAVPYWAAFSVSVGAWAVILIPAHSAFLGGGSAESFLGRLLLYAIVPFIGLAVFKPLIDTALQVRQRMQSLLLVMDELEGLGRESELADLFGLVSDARTDLRRVSTILDLIQSRTNPVFWLFLHALLPFDSVLCMVAWLRMRRFGAQFNRLVMGLVEFDVQAVFARFALENREFRFSSLTPLGAPSGSRGLRHPILRAVGMGHPLIPAGRRVCNSVSWSEDDGLVLLTGSNMSGKSTFLRSLGLNAVLHNLGAPVCAQEFTSPPLQLLCAIRVDDALEQGTSYFYAEVRRLAAVLRVLQSAGHAPAEQGLPGDDSIGLANGAGWPVRLPVYLVDEIFRGTNNRERFLGSLYVIRAFVKAAGLGIVTTHDLALTALPEHAEPGGLGMRNMHFRESVSQGQLVFDYVLRDGPCPTTNALRIMHNEGLPVPAELTQQDEEVLRASLQFEPVRAAEGSRGTDL
jgi:hypothetical protein